MTPLRFNHQYQMLSFWGLMMLLLGLAGYMMLPFVGALLWAVVLSILMWPFYQRRRQKLSENASASWTVLSTIIVVVVPLSCILWLVGVQLGSMAKDMQGERDPNAPKVSQIEQIMVSLDKSAGPKLHEIAPDFGFQKWYVQNKDQILAQVKPAAVTTTVQGVQKAGAGLLTVVIALLTMFFLLRDGHKLLDPAYDLVPLPREETQKILDRLYKTVHGVFTGVVLVALVQGTLATIGYVVAGVPTPLVFGVATTFLCIVPLLGAPVVYIPLSLLLIIQGNTGAGVGLLLWGFIVVSQIDNVLKPFLIGARVSMHPMGIFFSVLGGLFVLGPLGLIAGPMLLAVLLAMIEIVREQRTLEEPIPE